MHLTTLADQLMMLTPPRSAEVRSQVLDAMVRRTTPGPGVPGPAQFHIAWASDLDGGRAGVASTNPVEPGGYIDALLNERRQGQAGAVESIASLIGTGGIVAVGLATGLRGDLQYHEEFSHVNPFTDPNPHSHRSSFAAVGLTVLFADQQFVIAGVSQAEGRILASTSSTPLATDIPHRVSVPNVIENDGLDSVGRLLAALTASESELDLI